MAHAVKVCETRNPSKPPSMMTSRSRGATFSFGMKREMSQNIAAAPIHRVAIHAIGDTQLSKRSLVIGTPRPKMMLATSSEE